MNSTLIRLVAAAVLLLAGSVVAQAQQTGKVYRVGFVAVASLSTATDAFRQGLKEAGYVEGKNVIIEMRFAEGRAERLPELIAELLRLKLDVLVAMATPAALAAQKAATTVPVVFASVADPVAAGIVASLARPGGNITGTALFVGGSGLGGKWVELLKEAAPSVSHLAVLWNSANPSSAPFVREIQAAALTLKVKLNLIEARNDTGLEKAFAAIGASGAQAFVMVPDAFLTDRRAQIVQFAASKRLPTMYSFKVFADAGGLMAYGGSPEDSVRRSVKYVDKILKGAKPADLPVEQPTRFELVVNLKAAKAMGLKVPQSILQRADHIIE